MWLCGSGWGAGIVDRPTSRVGLFHWPFRVEGGQLSRALGDDRLISTEHAVEQGVPRGFPRPVLW